MSCESNDFMEKVGLSKGMTQDKITSDKMKEEADILNAYSIIVEDGKKNISRRVVIFIFVISALFTAALLTSVFIKQNNQKTYLQAARINSAYHNFMMILTIDIYFVQIINI